MAAPTVHLSTQGPRKEGQGPLHVTAMGPNLFLSVPLPAKGTLKIGRDESADLRILDESASRIHAELHVDERGQLFIEDLGTRNGTFLRETKLEPRRRVAFEPGEAITIGYAILMVQRRKPTVQARRLRTHAVFEERLAEACERGDGASAPFAVVRLRVEGDEEQGGLPDVIAASLQPTDILAQYAPRDYEVLLPDTNGERPRALAEDLGRRLRAEGHDVKTAVVLFPADGRTADALIGRANELLQGRDGAARGEPIIKSEPVRKLYRLAERAAAGQTANGLINILILGETGVGKDVLASWIHRKSPRAKGPFVSINCGALTETLLESELFGHEKGAFTGASETKAGLLEAAAGGTVFLDEVGDMHLSLQVKLLRALENREITRVGGVKARAIDVRFIAATHRDLEARVVSEEFRQDLFFRLNQVSLTLPPLRERPEEIEPLAQRFLADAVGPRRRAPRLSAEALEALRAYPWPGNARELRNMIERALIFSDGPEVTVEDLEIEKMRATTLVSTAPRAPVPVEEAASGPVDASLTPAEAAERAMVVRTMAECAGSQTAAAKKLGWSRGKLIERLKRYRILRPRASS
jgi:DNA-binding NtrC family response regulator